MRFIPNDEFQRLQRPAGSRFVRVNRCRVNGRTTDPVGFIDTRKTDDEGPVFVSVAAVKELGRMIDLVPKQSDPLWDRFRQLLSDVDTIEEREFLDRQIETLTTLSELEQEKAA